MAEELTGQLGESLPFALRAMTTAAAKAGLIDGSLSQQKQEAALRKLMENGKLIASEVLPEFGKELQRLANDGNALQKALDENLGPALGRARNTLQEMMVSTFKTLAPALKGILDSFTEIGSESHNLAKVLGTTLGAALLGLSFPILLTVGAVYDLITAIKWLTGTSDESLTNILTWSFGIAGALTGVLLLVKGIRMLSKAFNIMTKAGKGAADVVDKMSKATGGASQAVESTKLGGYTGGWNSVEKVKGAGTFGSKVGGFLGKLSGPLAALTGAMTLGERLNSTQERNQNIIDYLTKDKREFDYGKPMNLKIMFGIDGSGNINPYIEKSINEAMDNQMIEFYQNTYPSD